MSKMMMKMALEMLADKAGVTPEEIIANIEHFRHVALTGIATLERIDTRLSRIEEAMNLPPLPEIDALQIEGQNNG